MNICFRADSSALIGTGHIMRCLALAELLRKKGYNVLFICRDLPGNIIKIVELKNFKVYKLNNFKGQTGHIKYKEKYEKLLSNEKEIAIKEMKHVLLKISNKIDWFIIDHYAFDKEVESVIKPLVRRIMIIDDLANRQHDCDLLLDQNLYINKETRYNNLLPKYTLKLLGPKYVLLRKEFGDARKKIRKRDGSVKSILIFMGGTDPGNETAKVLDAVSNLDSKALDINVVIGVSNLNFVSLQKQCINIHNANIYQGVNNMAEMISKAGLCVGSEGTNTWERCCLGLPSLTIAITEHQIIVAELLDKLKVSRYLGFHSEINSQGILNELKKLLNSSQELTEMSSRGMRLVDGRGCERVCEYMFNL